MSKFKNDPPNGYGLYWVPLAPDKTPRTGLDGNLVGSPREPMLLLPWKVLSSRIEEVSRQRGPTALPPTAAPVARPSPARSDWPTGVDAYSERQEIARRWGVLARNARRQSMPPMWPVFTQEALLRWLDWPQRQVVDRPMRERVEHAYKTLKSRGPWRRLIAPEVALRSLGALDESHPHLAAVTSLVRERFKLAVRSAAPVSVPPILLLGSAGVGKTHYAKALAVALGSRMALVSLDSATTSDEFLGSSKHWGNTSSGLLYSLVVMGDHAAPVVVLDELDKAKTHYSGSSLAALHGLLEPVTAAVVTDLSMDITFDARHVVWLATANRIDRLSPSLISRFKVFEVSTPSAEDGIRIARAVAANVVREFGPPGFETPPRAIGAWLGHLTAREVRQAVSDAVARAVTNGRSILRRTDFDPHVLADESVPSGILH